MNRIGRPRYGCGLKWGCAMKTGKTLASILIEFKIEVVDNARNRGRTARQTCAGKTFANVLRLRGFAPSGRTVNQPSVASEHIGHHTSAGIAVRPNKKDGLYAPTCAELLDHQDGAVILHDYLDFVGTYLRAGLKKKLSDFSQL